MSSELPIHTLLPEIHQILAERNTLILQAAPGAGKSTYLPLTLLNQPWLKGKKIILLEPRRLAVKAVAARLAEQLGEKPGQTIGYRIRFENRISADTRLEVITEGILTRMLLEDSTLEEVGLLILDEFHERSLTQDTAFVLSRECQKIVRPDLRILVMSATLAAEKLAPLMDHCPVVRSEGRQFPVDIQYASALQADTPLATQVARAVRTAIQKHEGDILAFLPGTADIHKTAELLSDTPENIVLHTLYGDLPYADQDRAIKPDSKGRRKIVLSTSIAETSLTIEGIKVVIDSGFARVPRYDVRSGLTRLETVKVSRDAADQRAGRAGRVSEGYAYRLWSETSHSFLAAERKPEILEADLSPLILELAEWGVQNITELDWPDVPQAGSVKQAEEILERTGALIAGKISTRGKQLLKIPAHPRIAGMLLTAKTRGVISQAADIAAFMEERDPCPDLFTADIQHRLEYLKRWRLREPVPYPSYLFERIDKVSAQWKKILKSEKEIPETPDFTGLLIATAFPERVAKQTEPGTGRYRLSNGRFARIKDQDVLVHDTWLAIANMDAGQQEGKIFLAAGLDINLLSDAFETLHEISWDKIKSEIRAQEIIRYAGLTVESKILQEVPADHVQEILLQAVREFGQQIFDWDEKIESWQNRVLSLMHWQPDAGWPDVSTKNLLASPEEWLSSWLSTIRTGSALRKLNLYQVLKGILSWEQQQMLETLAPETITVPTGSKIHLKYAADGSAPVLAVRLQEIFGMADTPQVAGDQIPVIMHLLSPGYKPVQITRDLRSFWNNTYFEVRKDLKGRYPKHAWPDDPWTAEPVRKGRSVKNT